jgi:hypothetical protein
MKQIVPVLVNCFGISTRIRFSKPFMQEITQAYILKAYILKTEDRLHKERLVSFLKKGLPKLSKHISNVDMSIAELAKFNVKLREAKS